MPYKHPELQSNSPYYDDFEDTKNFLKVLFKPGYAVQARELTQLQTILQSQVAKFADHIFLDGSQVVGGKVNVSPVNYVRVNKLTTDSDGVVQTQTSDDFLNSIKRTVTSYDDSTLETNQILGTVRKTQLEVFKFVDGVYETESSGTVLLLHYEEAGYSAQDDFTVLFFLPLTGSDDGIAVNDLLKVKDEDVYFKIINPSSTGGIYSVAPYGTANIVSVDDGIFYLDGLFVKNYNQILVPFYSSSDPNSSNLGYTEDKTLSANASRNVRLFTYPSVRVGLTANKTAVTVLEDTTLRDPASGFYNSNAPGADRYKIELVLSQLPFDPQSVDVENYSNSDFIQLARLINGKTDWIRKLTNYSEILEIFARRTYDESGSYTVVPFQVEVKNHLRDDYYEVIVRNTPPDFVTGTYVFSANIANPYGVDLSTTTNAILEVINVTPYDDLKAKENLSAGTLPSIVRMRSKTSNRIAFDINADANGYGRLNYRSPTSNGNQIIDVKLISYQIDPSGTYSSLDIPTGDESKMVLSVQPGKAYVYGYEYENTFPKNVEYLKKDSDSRVDENITVSSSSVLGNYVIGSFQEDTNNYQVDWETLPKFTLNSEDLFVLIMEQGDNLSVQAPIYSWSPYKTWGSDTNRFMKGSTALESIKYESVLFINDPASGGFNNLYYDGNNDSACNNRSSPYNNIAGLNSQTKHRFHLISANTTNIVKASFLDEQGSAESYHTDFNQAYDPTVSSTTNGFITIGSETKYKVKQLDASGVVRGVGNCLRFVGGNSENSTDAYIQKTSTSNFISNGIDAGVLFQDTIGNQTSWGSSISSISQLEGVYQLQLVSAINSDEPAADSELPINYGTIAGTGTLTAVKIRKFTESTPNGIVVGEGYIFAVLGVDGNTATPEYVHVHLFAQTGNLAHGIPYNDNGTTNTENYTGTNNYAIESVKTLDGGSPCFRYIIGSSTRQDVLDNSLRFKRVEFKESAALGTGYDVSLANATVYQWDWTNITVTQAERIVAKPWAWVTDQSALYIQECSDAPFERKYGPIYQDLGSETISWGNRGFTSDTNFETRNGRFINIRHSSSNLYVDGKDYDSNWTSTGGESLIQVLQRQQSYEPSYNYTVGDKIFQIRSSEDYDYASATVVSWEYPDLTNPADNSPMKLVARMDKIGPDQPGNYIDVDLFQPLQTFNVGTVGEGVTNFSYDGKILPYSRLSLTETVIEEWPYEVNNTNTFFTNDKNVTTFVNKSTTPLPVVAGTTRIRNVSLGPTAQGTEDGILYKFYLFDTELNETNIFGDVTDIVFDDTVQFKKIVKIAPISGRKLVEEVFAGTDQIIQTRKTVIYDPSKDKLFFRLPTGKVFEEVVGNGFSVELQKMFNNTFTGASQEWTINDKFLVAEPNINWFVINSTTGQTYNLVEGNSPSINQIGYLYNQSSQSVTLYAPSSFEENVTLFAKTIVDITNGSIRKKRLTSKTETITGFAKGTLGSTKNQYYMELMSGADGAKGIINNIVTVYVVSSQGNAVIAGTENVISAFALDTGMTDQKIGRPKLILGSAYVKPNGKLDGSIFGFSGTEIEPSSVTLKITYEMHEFTEDPNSSKVSLRESFVDATNTVISNYDIPFYYSKNSGEIIHESAIIDFRPNTLKSTNDFTLGNTKFTPHPDWADTLEVNYYLPRRDKLILTKNGKFEILYGKPSLSPKYPSDVPNSMTLYLIDKDPFIFSPSSIKTKMVDNRRYTMRDIGKIEKRVQNLEYYTTLSIMEKKAEDMLVLDANGNDRFKNGILVDTFEGHKIGDVTNRDYNIAIDFSNKYARPPFVTHSNSFIKNPTGSTTFTEVVADSTNVTTGIFMFPYTEKVFVAQPLATRAITVQPHDTIQYEGLVNMLPVMDTWVSTIRRPDVNVNLAGENDAWNQMVSGFNNNNIAPFGTQWGEWETLSRTGTNTIIDSQTSTRVLRDWHLVKPGHAHGGSGAGRDARTIENTTVNTVLVNEELEQVRNGITRTLSTSTTDISLGDRVVDVRLIPYMREKNIKIVAKGLKPRTRVYVFFDGINVAEYCYKFDSGNALWNVTSSTDMQYLPFPGSNFLPAIGGVHFATGSSADLKTNDNGEIFIEFRMPDGVFRVGDRKLEITSDVRNDKSKATTYATAVYSASGLRTEVEETIATTRNFQISDPVQTSDSRTVNITGIFQETSTTTQVQTRKNDPLAQTFFVNADEHPEGIFLSSVDIFFARKPDDSTNLPVQIQIRPAVNGYPDSSRIYPGGKVVKQPSEIVVSEDASVKTNFKFDHPIHLPPGEHALVVKGDTSEYEIYIATLGDFILGTETKVTNQPYLGVFFTSANASTWSAEQNTDMMMVLNKCEFTTGQSYQLALKNEVIDKENKYELININSRYFDFNSCRTSWSLVGSIASSGETRTLSIEPNSDIQLTNTFSYGTKQGTTSTENPVRVTINAQTTNKDVCPVIDLQCLSFFAINNKVENNDSADNGELESFVPNNLVGSTPRARYISRVVTLQDGFDCNSIKCVLSVSKPIGTNIQVFAKMQDSQSTDDFHSYEYLRLTPNVQNFDTYYTEDPNEFREIEFQLPQDTSNSFNKFCIKVCLYSDEPWRVPKIRDLRAVAVL